MTMHALGIADIALRRIALAQSIAARQMQAFGAGGAAVDFGEDGRRWASAPSAGQAGHHIHPTEARRMAAWAAAAQAFDQTFAQE